MEPKSSLGITVGNQAKQPNTFSGVSLWQKILKPRKVCIQPSLSLHTALVDSRHSFEEAIDDADGNGLTSLFRGMIAVRTGAADAITQLLAGHGERSDDHGSFMPTVHRAVIRIRSLFGNLDRSILLGLIDGEKRILGYCDEVLSASSLTTSEKTILVAQRQKLHVKVSEMRQQNEVAA